MSRMTVTKLQVDVLVQAALHGPLEATNWTPLTNDPDELGRHLLSSGRRKSGKRNAEDYTFTPLPIALTAIEIIKACGYYQYQRAKSPAIVQWIARNMEGYLPGWKEAPWGWGTDNVTARLDRPAPGSDAPAPPPPALVEVAERLTSVGLKVHSMSPTVSEELDRATGGEAFYGSVLAVISHVGSNKAHVIVAKTPEQGEKLFILSVAGIAEGKNGGMKTDVLRIGNLVVTADLDFGTDAPALAEALARLGAPDEGWSKNEPPLLEADGGLVGGRVDMTLGNTVLARTPAELARLIAGIEDPQCRERLEQVDLREHSVLAVPGVQLADVAKVELCRSARSDSKTAITEDLILTTVRADRPKTTGSVVLTPRLKRRPDKVRCLQVGQSRFGFIGWGKELTRLSRL